MSLREGWGILLNLNRIATEALRLVIAERCARNLALVQLICTMIHSK